MVALVLALLLDEVVVVVVVVQEALQGKAGAPGGCSVSCHPAAPTQLAAPLGTGSSSVQHSQAAPCPAAVSRPAVTGDGQQRM